MCLWLLAVSTPASSARPGNAGSLFRSQIVGQLARERPIFTFGVEQRRMPRASLPDLRSWIMAAERHRAGQMDEAARTIAAWSRARLEVAVAEFENRVPGRLDIPLETPTASQESAATVLGRAVILHTDIAVATFRDLPDGTALLSVPSVHFGAAMELVDFLKRKKRDDPFAGLWYRAVLAFLQSEYELASAPDFADRAVSLFPGDADLLLMAGCAREMAASPFVQEAVDLHQELALLHGDEAKNLRQAESDYRRALAIAGDLAEARIRLGHVLVERGRHQEALGQLSGAAEAVPDLGTRYFAWLFLGDAYAGARDTKSARQAYQRAHDLFPGARSIHLALSRLAAQEGNAGLAAAHVREALTLGPGVDPWKSYYKAGPARHAVELLDRVRGQFGPRIAGE